uniref:SoxR reducing system RseC family protein n=1 Tax=Anaerococcus mediterraneensis TaxID=1870984 RepID=UPI000930BBAE|nr:SoxR reducing system RseC family protein [Anaerococcus mediterraneensis]
MSMTKEGIILENNNGKLKIQVDRTGACGSCASASSCVEKKSTIIEIFSADNFNEGDKVILESDADKINKLSALVYIFPAIMLLIGIVIPQYFMKNSGFDINLITLFLVIILLTISVLIIRNFDKKFNSEKLMKVRKA